MARDDGDSVSLPSDDDGMPVHHLLGVGVPWLLILVPPFQMFWQRLFDSVNYIKRFALGQPPTLQQRIFIVRRGPQLTFTSKSYRVGVHPRYDI